MKVDVTITNYHRYDLLGQLLYKLDTGGNELIGKVIIHHDGQEEENVHSEQNIELFSYPRVGQIIAIDKMMAHVTTEYVLALEEDVHPIDNVDEGIKEAIAILDSNPDCASVSLRGPNLIAHNGHPCEEVDGVLRMKKGWQGWSGYSHSPSVRRVSDYRQKAGTYASITGWDYRFPWLAEKKVGDFMTGKGWCATTRKPYFEHRGGQCSTVGK